jgi:hypothetical protein
MAKVDFGLMTGDETFETVVDGLGYLSIDQMFEAIKSGLSEEDLEELTARLVELSDAE